MIFYGKKTLMPFFALLLGVNKKLILPVIFMTGGDTATRQPFRLYGNIISHVDCIWVMNHMNHLLTGMHPPSRSFGTVVGWMIRNFAE
jgi:hypothetical protein